MWLGIEVWVVVEEADDSSDNSQVVEARPAGSLRVDLEHTELDGQLEVLLKLNLGEHCVRLQNLVP